METIIIRTMQTEADFKLYDGSRSIIQIERQDGTLFNFEYDLDSEQPQYRVEDQDGGTEFVEQYAFMDAVCEYCELYTRTFTTLLRDQLVYPFEIHASSDSQFLFRLIATLGLEYTSGIGATFVYEYETELKPLTEEATA
jgi:hypothetical protein